MTRADLRNIADAIYTTLGGAGVALLFIPGVSDLIGGYVLAGAYVGQLFLGRLLKAETPPAPPMEH